MGKAKVTLDTNILISALGWDGKPRRVFEKVLSDEIELIISEEQFEELCEVLDYPRLNFTEEEKDRFKSLIIGVATLIKPSEKINVIKQDPDDNMILEAAVAGQANYIVTGDPDLLVLKEFRGIRILTAKEFLNYPPLKGRGSIDIG